MKLRLGKMCRGNAKCKKRTALFFATLDLSACVGAVNMKSDRLVGLAGFLVKEKSLMSCITVSILFKRLGFWGELRAIAMVVLYQLKKQVDTLLMDGIAVEARVRGQGSCNHF